MLATSFACLHCPVVSLVRIFGIVALLLASARPASASDWTVIREQNRDYVSFANVAEFYQFSTYTRVNRNVSLRSDRNGIRAQAGTSELFINGVRFFTDFPILAKDEQDLISAMDVTKIIDPILRPHQIKNATKVQTVVLDPGHGGVDQGAANKWGTEKAFALDVALTARDQLKHAGFKVAMTRSTDIGLTLEERVAFADQFRNAVFISIHFNTSTGPGAGVETYALAPAGVPSNAAPEEHSVATIADMRRYDGNVQDAQNMALAAAVHGAVLSRVSVFDRGVHHARFHVLRNISIPAVLFEGGFLSNPAEGRRIATKEYRRQMGLAIAQAVQNYDAAVNLGSTGSNLASATSHLPPHTQSITESLSDDTPGIPHHDKPSVSISGGK